MAKYNSKLNNEAQQKLNRLKRIQSSLRHSMVELIQFFEFWEQTIDTFPTAIDDFIKERRLSESASLFTLQHSFKNNVLICLVRMYDKNKMAASIPNAVKILQNDDIRYHLKLKTDHREHFEKAAEAIDSIADQVSADFRFREALYMRDKHIAHRDIGAIVNWDRLSAHEIATLYLFTASVVESINIMLDIDPFSYTKIMGVWQSIARNFYKNIPYPGKALDPRPTKITSYYLGTREELEKFFTDHENGV